MVKLFNADILDIFPSYDGFVYASKEVLENGSEAIAFKMYNMKEDYFEKLTVNTYIMLKFGDCGFVAARNLVDFVTCRIEPISTTLFAASYGNGKIKFFDNTGRIVDEKKVSYLGNPAVAPVSIGKDFWMCVPDSNSIINYSTKYDRIEFRIGSPNDKSFYHPSDLGYFDNRLYICNTNAFKIRTLSLEDYSVADYFLFNEPVYRYFRSNNTEFVHLKSGIYAL